MDARQSDPVHFYGLRKNEYDIKLACPRLPWPIRILQVAAAVLSLRAFNCDLKEIPPIRKIMNSVYLYVQMPNARIKTQKPGTLQQNSKPSPRLIRLIRTKTIAV
jgi:hypothetical protein